MGLSDQVCNTGLALSLLVSHHDHKPAENSHFQQPDHQEKKRRKKDKFSLKYDHLFPSLTLGPSMVDACAGKASGDQSLSAVSSFSNSSEGEEAEVEKVSSRISNEDEEGSPRKKLRLTKQQSAILEDSFKEHSTLNPKQKQDLSRQLSLRPRQVEVWFQNRRARTKLKQTEVDCELLKKCCETLTEENKRLQKELQELKSLKLAAPFYMQLPAATLTICPSCERICTAGDGSSTSPFSIVAPKPHLYNPFNHPSAAC